MTEIYWVVFLL